MSLPSIHKVTSCGRCGASSGFYIKSRVSGVIHINFSFDGSAANNCEMYDSINHKDMKFAYCQCCNEKVGVWDKDSQKIVPDREKPVTSFDY